MVNFFDEINFLILIDDNSITKEDQEMFWELASLDSPKREIPLTFYFFAKLLLECAYVKSQDSNK